MPTSAHRTSPCHLTLPRTAQMPHSANSRIRHCRPHTSPAQAGPPVASARSVSVPPTAASHRPPSASSARARCPTYGSRSFFAPRYWCPVPSAHTTTSLRARTPRHIPRTQHILILRVSRTPGARAISRMRPPVAHPRSAKIPHPHIPLRNRSLRPSGSF